MKKPFLIFTLLTVATLSFAIQPDTEIKYPAEDFVNQSMIVTQDDRDARKCQAVRILPKWYLTAAHCVDLCKSECTVIVHLLQGDLQAQAFVRHNTLSNPQVYSYYPKDGNVVRADIALIHFDPQKDDYFFYDAKNKAQLTDEQFRDLLNRSQYREEQTQWEMLQRARPVLYSVGDKENRKLLGEVMVPRLRADGIFPIGGENFYYFGELRHYIGPNFGVVQGQSGSGVVLRGGAIVGVVSSLLLQNGQIVTYDGAGHPTGTKPYSSNYFF